VKLQPPDALKPARSAGEPTSAPARNKPVSTAWCKTVPVVVALAHGCTAAQLKPEPFKCPPGAREAMFDKLGWDTGDPLIITMDEKGPSRGHYFFTPGPVVGVVPDDASGQEIAPPGTLFTGRLYLTEKTARNPLGELVVIYDHVEIPNKGKFPVCVVRDEIPVLELKDGTAKAPSVQAAYPVRSWRKR
jgi:eukaryotic-like serine/threonine-protein kinase